MPIELLTALVAFAFVTSITPGPNNVMLMTSGANFGLRRTVPHMLGITLGHGFMVFVLGVGLAQVFVALPQAQTGLKVAAVLYMTYLAWRLSRAAAPGEGRSGGRPFTFLEAAGFQWVNPKAWAMALTAVSVYAPDQALLSALLVAVVFGAVNFPSVSVWAVLGVNIRRWLTTPGRLKAFNWTMAVLLLGSLWPVLAA